MIRAFKYRLYPTKGQEETFDETLRLCRTLYNAALEERRTAYRKCGVSISYQTQQDSLPEVKEGCPEYKDIHSQVLQDVLRRLDKAFKAFFRRVKTGDTPGYPRFQGRNRYDSFTYSQAGKTGAFAHPASKEEACWGTVMLSGIGPWEPRIRCRFHRPFEGKLKTATVKRDVDEWYVIFTAEVEAQPLAATGNSVGADMGLTDLIVTSDAEFVEAPKHYRNAQKELRKAQRSLARKKKGSKRREKARVRVAKLHRKVRRQRADFAHKLSRKLVNENDLIALEDLNIRGLARSRLAKSICDAAWGQLTEFLTYKAENAGRQVVKVPAAYTTQTCSCCGHREKHPLSVRWFVCPMCNTEHHRDVNAAMNIRAWATPSCANVDAVKVMRSTRSTVSLVPTGVLER